MTATDIEQKIAKLLAMAEGTTNVHEAEAFMAQAEKLMLKHGIERAELEAKTSNSVNKTQPVVIKKVHVPDGHGYAIAIVAIAHNIGDSFSVRTLQSSGLKNSKYVWFIGHQGDVDDVTQLFASLTVQSIAQAKAWWKNEGRHQWYTPTDNGAYLARREFIFAFGSGAGSRLRETRNQVVAEAGVGTELVLVDRAKAVDVWIDSNLKIGKGRATNRRTGGSDARQAGREAGRNAIGGKALGR